MAVVSANLGSNSNKKSAKFFHFCAIWSTELNTAQAGQFCTKFCAWRIAESWHPYFYSLLAKKDKRHHHTFLVIQKNLPRGPVTTKQNETNESDDEKWTHGHLNTGVVNNGNCVSLVTVQESSPKQTCMCTALSHVWATEVLEASTWVTKDNMAADSQIRLSARKCWSSGKLKTAVCGGNSWRQPYSRHGHVHDDDDQ